MAQKGSLLALFRVSPIPTSFSRRCRGSPSLVLEGWKSPECPRYKGVHGVKMKEMKERKDMEDM
jgi:hypothetical protein